MKKISSIIIFLFISYNFFSQDLKIINNTEKRYKIDIPKDWEENKMFYSSTTSLMALKPKNESDPNPYEAIAIKHSPTSKKNINDAFDEYHNLLKGYYKKDFKILSNQKLSINGRTLIKLIAEVTSHINGKKKKNIMIFAFANQESTMITLTSSPEKYDSNVDLFKKIYSSFILQDDINNTQNEDFKDLISDIRKIDLLEPENLNKLKSKYSSYKIAKRDLALDNENDILKRQVKKMNIGQIIQKADKNFALKLLNIKSEKSAKVSAINLLDSDKETEGLAKKIIEEYKSGSQFSELAKRYSKDKFYSKKGGDIGWIKKGYMIKEIDEAIFSHKKGDVISVNAPKLGWTIILINESPINNKFAELLIVKK